MSICSKAETAEDVKMVFKNMYECNLISWTTMISADEGEVVSRF